MLGWVILVGVIGLEAYRRLVQGVVPPDLSAYLAAADVFAAGHNPYGAALFDSALYDGYPYVYPPGTLPLISPLAWASPAAVAIFDLLARSLVAVLSLRWLGRRFLPDVPLGVLGALAILYQPFVADFATGNVATYLLGAFLLCVHLSRQDWRGWHLPAGLVCGLILAFKPMWGLAAGAVLLANRRWRASAAVFCGAVVVGGLTAMHVDLVGPWLDRVGQVRDFYRSFDLLAVAPALLPVAAIIWLGAGVALWRREAAREHLWLWACVSLWAWPRLATYSYVLLVPVLVFLWRRWGYRRAGALALVGLGPIPWLLLDFGEFTYLAVLYVWALALSVIVWREIWSGE